MDTKSTITPKSALESVDYYMVGISKLDGIKKPIKLSSNESALGMSPFAIEAVKNAVTHCHLYPEVDTEELAVTLGKRFDLDPQRMAFGPGSDELLTRIINTFSGPGQELIHSKHAYMQFPIYAKLSGATPIAANDNDFHYSVDAILDKVNEKTAIVIIANPDNPSGTYLSGAEVRRLHAGLAGNVLLIIDAAYEEFALTDDYESGTKLVHEFDNVIVTRTFSKVYGMAGLRLGWCYGPHWAVDLMTKIGPSFPVNTLAYAAGIACVNDTAHTKKVLSHTNKWTQKFIDQCNAIGLKAYPSQTNFVLVSFPDSCGRSSDEVNQHLNRNGIIPRQFALDSFMDKLRFTVGTDDEMEKTLEVLKNYIASA